MASKINISPPVASAAVHSKAVVLLLFIHCLLLLRLFVGGLVLGLSFVLQYLVSFLVLQSSGRGRESWLLYFCCSECHVAVIILLLFLAVLWVGLLYVRGLIWVCTVCLCPTKRMLGLYGLTE